MPRVRESEGQLLERPIFLVGPVRSGTTVLRLMLDHHPGLSFHDEFQYAVDLLGSEGWPQLDAYYRFLDEDRIFRDSGLTVDRRLNYPRLVDSFLRQWASRGGKPLVGTTVHRHFDRLLRIWPDARFIYMLRDGRDVGRSYIGMGWAGTMYWAVQPWIDAETLWKNFCMVVPADRRTEVRYESLVRDPVDTLTRLCDFIGLPYDPAMLSYPKDTTYEYPNPGLADQWRTTLFPRNVQLAESRIAPMLQERGYELSGHPPLRIGRLSAWRLAQMDRFGRLSFRLRREGVSLFCASLLVRLTNPFYKFLERQRTHVILRVHDVERSNLK
jgi:Sulfotransferase family